MGFGLQHRAMGEGGRKVGSREKLVNGLFFGHRVVGFFFSKQFVYCRQRFFSLLYVFLEMTLLTSNAGGSPCRGASTALGSFLFSIGVSSTNFLQKKKKRKQSSTASADVRGSVLAPQRAPDQGPESCALLSARFAVSTKTDFSMWDL